MTIAEPYISPPPDAEPATIRKVSDLLHELGDISGDRVLARPAPGTATEADLLRLSQGPNKIFVELVDGTLVEKPVGFDEDRLGALIVYFLASFVLPRNLGTVSGAQGTLRMQGGNVRIPDVTFISWTSMPNNQLPPGPIKTLPPDLAVEVLSETNTRAEMDRKRQEYFKSGGRLVWEFDAEDRSATAYTSAADKGVKVDETGILDGSPVLPGFTLSMRELFAAYDLKGPG